MIANVSRDDFCAYCRNDGLVVHDVGWRHDDPDWQKWRDRVRRLNDAQRRAAGHFRLWYGEQMAPCPRCERGRQLEFPPSGRGDWGHDGFWRGREFDGEPHHQLPWLTLDENRERWKRMVGVVGRVELEEVAA